MKHLDWHQFLFRFLSIFSILLSSSFVIGYRTTRALEAATSNPPGLVVAQGLNDTTVQLTWMAVVVLTLFLAWRKPGRLFFSRVICNILRPIVTDFMTGLQPCLC